MKKLFRLSSLFLKAKQKILSQRCGGFRRKGRDTIFKRYEFKSGKQTLVYDEDMHPWSMTKRDHFDTINSSSRNFNTQNLLVRYEIEYQDENLSRWQDESKWELEPWEYYHKVETDSLGEAFHEFVIHMMDDSPTEPKFFMQIINSDGNEIAETYMDIPHSLRPTLRQMVDENIRQRENSYEAEIETLRKENQLYKEFVEKYHATEQFRKFREENYNA